MRIPGPCLQPEVEVPGLGPGTARRPQGPGPPSGPSRRFQRPRRPPTQAAAGPAPPRSDSSPRPASPLRRVLVPSQLSVALTVGLLLRERVETVVLEALGQVALGAEESLGPELEGLAAGGRRQAAEPALGGLGRVQTVSCAARPLPLPTAHCSQPHSYLGE